jgi:hypothetical protein
MTDLKISDFTENHRQLEVRAEHRGAGLAEALGLPPLRDGLAQLREAVCHALLHGGKLVQGFGCIKHTPSAMNTMRSGYILCCSTAGRRSSIVTTWRAGMARSIWICRRMAKLAAKVI